MKHPLSLSLRGLAFAGIACMAASCTNQPYYRPDGNVFIREDGRPKYGYQGTNAPAPTPTPPSKPKDLGEDPEKLHNTPEKPPTTDVPPTTGNTTPPTDPTSPEKPVKPNPNASLPFGTPVIGEKGYVYSPYAPDKGKVDVKDIPSGTKVECPYTKKIFRVP